MLWFLARPLEEKLAELESKAQEADQQNLEKINSARKRYQQESEKQPSPEQRLEEFRKTLGKGYSWYNEIPGSQAKYNSLVNIANHYQARCDVSIKEAQRASDEYSFIKERALIYVNELKKLSSKLSVKDRQILDAAREKGLRNIDLPVTSEASPYTSMPMFSSERWESFGEVFKAAGESAGRKRQAGESSSVELVTVLATATINVFGDVIDKIKDANEQKKSLKIAEANLVRQIGDTIEPNRRKAEAFRARVEEINRSM